MLEIKIATINPKYIYSNVSLDSSHVLKVSEVQISGIDTKIEYLPIDTLLSNRIVKLHNIFYHVPLRTNIVIKVDIIAKKT